MTQTLTVHSPVWHQSLGVGGTIMRDEHGPVTQCGIMVDLAYRMFLGGDNKLAFGLKGRVNPDAGVTSRHWNPPGQRPGVPAEREHQDRCSSVSVSCTTVNASTWG